MDEGPDAPGPTGSGPSAAGDQRLGQVAHEVLELARGPALVGVAVLLVGGNDGVAVVPVQPRLGVEPERAARLRGDRAEDLRGGVAAVGARVAEDDHGRSRVELVLDLVAEL